MTQYLTIDRSRFDRAMDKLSAVASRTGIDASDLLRDQMRLFVQTIVKWTPPKSMKEGRDAIRRDALNMTAFVYEDDAKFRELLADADATGAAFRLWPEVFKTVFEKTKEGAVKIPVSALDRDGSLLTQASARLRDRRGRIQQKRTMATLVTSRRVLTKFMREPFSHVGNLKKGWQTACAKLGIPLPAWAAKAESGLSGAPSGGLLEVHGQNPSIMVWNDTPYIRIDQGTVRRALSVRRADIEKHLEKRLRKLCKEQSAA